MRRSFNTRVDAVLQAMTQSSDWWSSISPEKQLHDACGQLRLAPMSIRKAGIVRDVDEAPFRHEYPCLTQDGEPPNTGIENENRCGRPRFRVFLLGRNLAGRARV